MAAIPPMSMFWDGESFTPKHPRLADKHYVVGESYVLAPYEARSLASHNHFFACVHDAWLNLREAEASRFPTAEHLRKWALIKAGYADERSIVCASKAEARRVAAFIAPMDEYAVVLVSEATIKVYTAQSQSMKAMGAKAFQESKDKVLGILSDLIGTDRKTLVENAGRAA